MKKSNVYRMATVAGIVVLAVNLGNVQDSFSASTDPDHDWKFRVPVELEGMLITEAKVVCSAQADGIIGQGEQSFTIGSDGSYSSTVTVFVTVNEGENPFDADSYSCSLKLKSNDDDGYYPAQFYESEYRAEDLSIKAKEGAEFASTVSGDLPTP